MNEKIQIKWDTSIFFVGEFRLSDGSIIHYKAVERKLSIYLDFGSCVTRRKLLWLK